jgi:hypothetical protein
MKLHKLTEKIKTLGADDKVEDLLQNIFTGMKGGSPDDAVYGNTFNPTSVQEFYFKTFINERQHYLASELERYRQLQSNLLEELVDVKEKAVTGETWNNFIVERRRKTAELAFVKKKIDSLEEKTKNNITIAPDVTRYATTPKHSGARKVTVNAVLKRELLHRKFRNGQ